MTLQINTSLLLWGVVGGHRGAEVVDRSLANRLRNRIGKWFGRHGPGRGRPPCLLWVCCDIWSVHHAPLHWRPTISLRGLGSSALSACFYGRFRPNFAFEQHLIVHFDPEFTDLRVCLWGMTGELTVDALNALGQKCLHRFPLRKPLGWSRLSSDRG